ALNLLSKAAFLAASRHARGDVVMAACSEVKFLAPVRLGQALALSARITRTGRSSMTVRVEGAAETLASGESHSALEGSFEMVAVDALGQPVTCAHSKEFL
ncbi:MAG: acyl-CoA thioesterase, partial [Polaromonas sp.]